VDGECLLPQTRTTPQPLGAVTGSIRPPKRSIVFTIETSRDELNETVSIVPSRDALRQGVRYGQRQPGT
jgi:hypothetical protein